MKRVPPDREEDESTLHVKEGTVDGRGSDPDHLYWQQFAEAKTPKAFCQGWLSLQCRYLKDVMCAMVLLGPPDEGPFSPIAFWPDSKHNMTHLTGAVERALKERRGLLMESPSTSHLPNVDPETHHVAYPIEMAGKINGVVVLEVARHPRHELQAILQQLHWGAAWLEIMLRRREALKSEEINKRFQHVLDAVTSAVEQEGFQAAAMGFVTKLATVFDCDRVSLGFVKGRHVRVNVLSHTADFGKQTNIMRAVGSAMDEALDQRAVLVFPCPSGSLPVVTREHEALSRQHGAGAILTVPLQTEGSFFGGLTFERPADMPFDEATVEACKTIATLVGPILKTKRSDDRWLIQKIGGSVAAQSQRLLGPGYLLRKIILILILGLIIFFYFFKVEYRVTAQTNIEGAVQRVVAAPFSGYVKDSRIRSGDILESGQVMCLLDDRDLKLERLKWVTEKKQLVNQYDEAMAKHDRAQIRIFRAKIDQAEAQIALLDEQLSRAKIVAPFRSVVISGDLSQALGAPVERGQVLFEVAPLDRYRVIAQVDERDIGSVVLGQKSELVLPSMPGRIFPFVIKNLTPVTTAKEGRNFFRVEGEIQESTTRLRPGMEGVSKISIDRRRLIWVWTHKAINWLHLKLWRWSP